MKFKKTSISLPQSSIKLWLTHRKLLAESLPGLLALFRRKQPQRQTLTQYTRSSERCSIISVYWPLEMHNDLHAVAGALRISVSHLLLIILRFLRLGGKTRQSGLSYGFEVIAWNATAMDVRETLLFHSLQPAAPPPLTP